MTNTELKLTRIESLCHACLELDRKATMGPWQQSVSGAPYVFGEEGAEVCKCDSWQRNESNHKANAAFIVQARDICPHLAKSTLTAIAALREIAALPTGQESSGDQCSAVVRAMYALTEIASHFDV